MLGNMRGALGNTGEVKVLWKRPCSAEIRPVFLSSNWIVFLFSSFFVEARLSGTHILQAAILFPKVISYYILKNSNMLSPAVGVGLFLPWGRRTW